MSEVQTARKLLLHGLIVKLPPRQVIGKWFKGLAMRAGDVVWGTEPPEDTLVSSNDLNVVLLPKSRCSEPCGLGAVKKMTEVDRFSVICRQNSPSCTELDLNLDLRHRPFVNIH